MEDLFQKKKLLVEILHSAGGAEHFHPEVELLYVLEGGLTVIRDGKESVMGPHDILVINSGKPHALLSAGNALFLRLSIQYSLISDIVETWDAYFWCDSTRSGGEDYSVLETLLRRLLARYLGNRGNTADFLHISLCYQILDCLCAHFMVQGASASDQREEEKFAARRRQISTFIQSNYASPIGLKELSEKLYLSSGYLSRFFQRQFGMGFNKYLTKVRLHHAMDALLYTEAPITRIVYDTGFANVTVFNKAFKEEYGETPTALRKRLGQANPRQPDALSQETTRRLENLLWQNGPPEETGSGPEKLPVAHSALDTRPLEPIWNRLINIGTCDELLRSEVREHVLSLRKTLGITYVRFWNPFSRNMLIDVRQIGRYNFSRLDSVLDFLLENGIFPFLELGFKPRVLELNTSQTLVQELPEEAETAEQWLTLLEAFLRHEIARHGPDAVEQWRFELWMPHEALYEQPRRADYAARFRDTLSLIHRYLPRAEVGGCGMLGHPRSTDGTAPLVSRFNRELLAAGCVPDFVSLYVYSYDINIRDGRLQGSTRSSDRDFCRHCAEEFRRAAPELQAAGTKLYITEWNLTVSHRNWLNDSCFKGAYIVRNCIDLLGSADLLGYYLGSDRVSEYYDTNCNLFGGAGLMTKDGILKPAGYAFAFLNRVYGRLIGKGERYLLTTDGRGSFCLLCHNMRELSHNYYLDPEDRLDREHLARYFEDTEPLTLNLALSGVENGGYRLRIRRINDNCGSVLRHWRELNYEPELSRADVQYLHKICCPHLSMQTVTVSEGVLRLEYTMQANEIALLKFDRVL